jgi:hypothetical protein
MAIDELKGGYLGRWQPCLGTRFADSTTIIKSVLYRLYRACATRHRT